MRSSPIFYRTWWQFTDFFSGVWNYRSFLRKWVTKRKKNFFFLARHPNSWKYNHFTTIDAESGRNLCLFSEMRFKAINGYLEYFYQNWWGYTDFTAIVWSDEIFHFHSKMESERENAYFLYFVKLCGSGRKLCLLSKMGFEARNAFLEWYVMKIGGDILISRQKTFGPREVRRLTPRRSKDD